MENRFLLILVLGVGTKGFTQVNDQNIGLQYSLYPSGKEYTTVSKTELFANVQSKRDGFNLEHAFQLEMDQVDLPIENWVNGSDISIYDLRYTLNLNVPISGNLAIGGEFQPSVTSMFETTFSSEDVFFYGGAYAQLKGNIAAIPLHLEIGMTYSSDLGEPEVLPVLAFSAILSEEISFRLGFPESQIIYRVNPASTLAAELKYEGKYVNLNSPLLQQEKDPADKLKWEWTSLGLNFSHEITSLWTIEFGAGYLLKNEFSLKNENGKTVSAVKLDPSVLISSGIKLKFN